MFTKLLRYTLVSAVLVVGLLACDNDFEKINDNPNVPTEAPADFLMPRAMQTSLNRLYDMDGINGYVGSIWTQGYAKIQYVDEDKYDFSGRIDLVNSIWQSFYSRSLMDLETIKSQARAANKQNVLAMAMIMKSWNFQIMSDLWGYVPYSEALQGAGNTTPVYDSQESVYKALIDSLDAAAGMIDPSGSPLGSADLVYGGDMAKWQKLANSLQMRLYMRLSEADAGYAESGIASMVSNGDPVFTSNDDNAAMAYLPFPNNNPVNEFLRTRQDHKVSETVIDTLKHFNDPRLRIYAVPVQNDSLVNAGTTYQGIPNGDTDIQNSIPISQASTMGAYFISPTSPGRIMTYAELKFIMAEAAARNWIGADAETQYEEAITAAMMMYDDDEVSSVLSGFPASDVAYQKQSIGECYDNGLSLPGGITQQEVNTYLNQASVQYDQANWRQQIGLQKWLALYSQGVEMWAEYRRLNYPELQPGPDALLSNVPQRLSYPQIEASLNSSNLEAAMEAQGIAVDANYLQQFGNSVWWDQ